jgi:ATP-dependent Clp protease protease subunit
MNKKKLTNAQLEIQIPSSIENMQLPSPELITYYKNLDERILWLDTDVDDLFLEYGRYIIQWNREDKGLSAEERKPIKLMFFSNGGDLGINNAMIDIIKMSTTKIIGINMGIAASAGCFIYLACHERLAMPNSTFLIHQGAGEFQGTYDIVISAVMNYQREIEVLGEYILENTKIDKETFDANFATDWYIPAKDAVGYGICDRLITNLDEIL